MPGDAFAADNPHGLILYDYGASPCARRVRVTLLEKGLSWATQIIDLSRLEQRNADYLRLNPNGVVPTLAHGERVIYESNVITEYLDDAFPEPPLYPSDPWELAQVKMWQAAELAMAKDYRPLMYQRVMGPMIRLTRSLDQALAAVRESTSDPADLAWEEKVWNLAVVTPAEEAQVETRLWQWLDTLERHLEARTYLVAERFTQAEISVYPRVMMYPFVQLRIAADRHPNVGAWMARCAERPSFAATLSPQDRQIAELAATPLLPWLGKVLTQPRHSLGERLRLFGARRMARRRLAGGRRRAARRDGAPAILQPHNGAVAPVSTPLRRQSLDPALRTDPLTLYDYSLSPHGRRLCILMREKGLTWQTVDIDLGHLEHKASAVLALNPNGELPVLCHGERVIYDSALIAEYLDRLYPGVPFYPDDAFLAAQVRMWLALEAGAHKELRPLFWLHVVRPRLRAAGIGEEDVDAIVPASVDASHRDWLRSVLAGTPRFDSSEELAREIVRKKLDVVERRLGGRQYLVDHAVTMADVAWFTRVDMLPQLGMPHDRARHPNLLRWLEHLRTRPSFAGAR